MRSPRKPPKEKVKRKLGRPAMPYKKLSEAGRRKRKYRARSRVALSLLPLIEAASAVEDSACALLQAAEAMAAAAAEAEAAKAAAMMKQQKKHERLQREMAPDRGFRDEATRLAVDPFNPNDECPICMDDDDAPDCRTPCCKTPIHGVCANTNYTMTDIYENAPQRTREGVVEEGRAETPQYPKRIETTHLCPFCRRKWSSARMLTNRVGRGSRRV